MTLGQRLVLHTDRFTALFARIEARRIQTYLRLFPFQTWLRGSARVLDIGCGTGDLTSALCDFTSGSVTGLDCTDLRRAAVRARRRFQYVSGNAESLPFDAESFDCVLLIVMLHHVQWPGIALREAWRVLAPGGRLVVIEDLAHNSSSWRTLFTKFHDSVVNLEFLGHPHNNKTLGQWDQIIRAIGRGRPLELRAMRRSTGIGSVQYGVLVYEKLAEFVEVNEIAGIANAAGA
jgi:ubiquinone/menaquinone biosynthesis C-methylase UbiE